MPAQLSAPGGDESAGVLSTGPAPPSVPAASRWGFHVLTVLAILVCLLAGWWQWQRAHRTEADAVPVAAPVALADLDPRTAFSGMRVQLNGTFDPARGHEILVQPRSHDDQPGAWVLTPLLPSPTAGTTPAAVAVVRGWVPSGQSPAAAPAGQVSVVGVLVADVRVPGATAAGNPPAMSQVDSGALSGLAGYPVRSGWFALQEMDPYPQGQPQPLAVTELPGAEVGLNWRNLSYAVQWVVFAGFVAFFWIRFRRELDRPEQELSR